MWGGLRLGHKSSEVRVGTYSVSVLQVGWGPAGFTGGKTLSVLTGDSANKIRTYPGVLLHCVQVTRPLSLLVNTDLCR